MKNWMLYVALMGCLITSKVSYAQGGVDTVEVKMKLIAIDDYKNVIQGGGQKKMYLLLLEVSTDNMSLLYLDSSYCKNRIVADYSAFEIKNLVEGKMYNVRLKVNKYQYSKSDLERQRKSVGHKSSCIDMNLNRRGDIQYWIIDIKE